MSLIRWNARSLRCAARIKRQYSRYHIRIAGRARGSISRLRRWRATTNPHALLALQNCALAYITACHRRLNRARLYSEHRRLSFWMTLALLSHYFFRVQQACALCRNEGVCFCCSQGDCILTISRLRSSMSHWTKSRLAPVPWSRTRKWVELEICGHESNGETSLIVS
ncbi:hypothetical protein CC86DRAFT_159021 [Ophiobolus disseminans]|uniref:Uncharacterized protein n=1 Tax=Ophiobolus disseminans TaxID=1469910 RepID=A0A6A6ZBR8_9PLEO|nr:hypothetical protein CC86DRAFT_159021 [Ophiobolus disseminans]